MTFYTSLAVTSVVLYFILPEMSNYYSSREYFTTSSTRQPLPLHHPMLAESFSAVRTRDGYQHFMKRIVDTQLLSARTDCPVDIAVLCAITPQINTVQ